MSTSSREIKDTSIVLRRGLDDMTLGDLILDVLMQFEEKELVTVHLKLLARYLKLMGFITHTTFRFFISLTETFSYLPFLYNTDGTVTYGAKSHNNDFPKGNICFNPERAALMIVETLASDEAFSKEFVFTDIRSLLEAADRYPVRPLAPYLFDDKINYHSALFVADKLYLYEDSPEGKTFLACDCSGKSSSHFADFGEPVFERLMDTPPTFHEKQLYFRKYDPSGYIRLNTVNGEITMVNEFCHFYVKRNRLVKEYPLDYVYTVLGLDGIERDFDTKDLSFMNVVDDKTILCGEALERTIGFFCKPFRLKDDGTRERASAKENAFLFWFQVTNLDFRMNEGFSDADALINRAILRSEIKNTELTIEKMTEILARAYAAGSVKKNFFLGMTELLHTLRKLFSDQEDLSDVMFNVLAEISRYYKFNEYEGLTLSDFRRIIRLNKMSCFKELLLNDFDYTVIRQADHRSADEISND